MLKEYDLIRYQQQHPDQFRPYGKSSSEFIRSRIVFLSSLVEMPRIRKDSETLSNCGYSTISRSRRESDRLRGDPYATDNANTMAPRNVANASIIREVCEESKPIDCIRFLPLKKTKIYRLPQYPNQPSSLVGSTPNENKSLLLSSGKRMNFFSDMIETNDDDR